jgi:hypothetical protein
MLSTAWLSAFAPVGVVQSENRWAAFGACVFFHKPPFVWLVTANHVVEKVGQQALTVLVTRSSGDGVVVVEVGKILNQHGLGWVQDGENDLAAAPMPMSQELGIKAAVAQNDCLPLANLVPAMACFTVGCPYGVPGVNPQKATPLVLDGVISGVDLGNRKVYTSAPTFPGNSGGPLVAVRTPFDPGAPRSSIGSMVLFAGIMLETRLLHHPDPASRIPPLHLGVAAPVDAVLSLLDSEQAQSITERLKALPAG